MFLECWEPLALPSWPLASDLPSLPSLPGLITAHLPARRCGHDPLLGIGVVPAAGSFCDPPHSPVDGYCHIQCPARPEHCPPNLQLEKKATWGHRVAELVLEPFSGYKNIHD